MLQSNQIEKPRCSATIDQMRLRRAIVLPLVFQNVSSSGFQSEIQVELRLLIAAILWWGGDVRGGTQSFSQALCQMYVIEKSKIFVGIPMRVARFLRTPCLVFVQRTIVDRAPRNCAANRPIRPLAISIKPMPGTGSGRTANTATAVARTRAAQLQGALEPVDRPEEVPLAERHAAMTQNVVRRRYKEKEIWKGELLQIIVALQFPVVAAGGPGDDLAFCAIDLCASQRLHEAEGGFDAAFGGGEAGVIHSCHGGGSNAS